jgi:hypothetical protein
VRKPYSGIDLDMRTCALGNCLDTGERTCRTRAWAESPSTGRRSFVPYTSATPFLMEGEEVWPKCWTDLKSKTLILVRNLIE